MIDPGHRIPALADLQPQGAFASRHIGPRPDDVERMLAAVGHPSMDALVDTAVPEVVRDRAALDLPAQP